MPSSVILVVDDEPLAREKLCRLLNEFPESFQIQVASNALEALEKIRECPPDVILLDIEMPALNGFEMLQQLENRNFKVIFQTAYDEFAIQAFQENAIDYLLKPYTKKRFEQSVRKALDSIASEQKLEELEQRLLCRNSYLNKITVKRGHRYHVVPLNEILCFVSRDHCTCLYTEDSEFIIDLSLSRLEERIDPNLFVRIHRNSLAQLAAVKEIKVERQMRLVLSNGMQLDVSRAQRSRVKELLV